MGDWGFSFAFLRPVLEIILERLWATILLTGVGLFLAILLGILSGIMAAVKMNSPTAYMIAVVALILYSTPIFVAALILRQLFAINMRLFPISGMVSIGVTYTSLLDYIKDVSWHVVLPAISLALIFMALYMRLMQASMSEALLSNYILAAKARGIKNKTIVFKHALRNALLPIITVAGLQTSLLVGGVIVTETVYSWPGMGRLVIEAVAARDHPLLIGIFLLSSITVIVANFIVDVIYSYVDPRISLR